MKQVQVVGWLLFGLVLLLTGVRFWLPEHVFPKSIDLNRLDVLACAALYLWIVILIRWQMIAKPVRNLIAARLRLLERAKEDISRSHQVLYQEVSALIGQIETLLNTLSFLDVIFWSRGQETALWLLIDEAEMLLAACWSRERLEARLPPLAELLTTSRYPGASAFASRVTSTLGAIDQPEKSSRCVSDESLQELYIQGLQLQRKALHQDDVEQDYYHNKLLWYIASSLGALVLVLVVLPSYVSLTSNGTTQADTFGQYLALVVAGAVGGIMSRMTNVIQAPTSESSHRQSWMSLFLSPLAGALAGWAGIILLSLFSDITSNVDALKSNTMTVGIAQLALAMLFGFSERLLVTITSQAEQKLYKPSPPAPTASPQVGANPGA